MPFDIARIEAAVARAARAVNNDDPDMPVTVSRAVADARRAELGVAKALLGVRDELKLSLAAVTVLQERYLIRDELGQPVESTGEMMDRAANCVAAAEDGYRRGSSPQWAERFSILLRNLEFLPISPTLMNTGTDLARPARRLFRSAR